MMKTLEQERASFCIKKIKSITPNMDKYKNYARSLPSFIILNGLIATLAFYKSKDERKLVYDTINDWLKNKGFVNRDALEELNNVDFQTLRLATIEVLAIANWLKRIVEAEL